MDITDPGTEVWICPCGSPRSEPGLCPQCELEACEPVDMRPMVVGISIVLIAVGIGLIGSVVLMFHAAWLAHLTFSGGSK